MEDSEQPNVGYMAANAAKLAGGSPEELMRVFSA